MDAVTLRTARLALTPWFDNDAAALAEICADPEVMRYFPSVLSRAESDRLLALLQADFERRGWGFWAVREVADGEPLGFVGLAEIPPDIPVDARVEVGWRLARRAWGQGLASEAARASLDFAFDSLDLADVVAYTAEVNLPSRRVMERIGMAHDATADFNLPALPSEHPLSRHVVYRIDAATHRAGRKKS